MIRQEYDPTNNEPMIKKHSLGNTNKVCQRLHLQVSGEFLSHKNIPKR